MSSAALLPRAEISASSLFGVMPSLELMVLFCLQEINTICIYIYFFFYINCSSFFFYIYGCFISLYALMQYFPLSNSYAVQQK